MYPHWGFSNKLQHTDTKTHRHTDTQTHTHTHTHTHIHTHSLINRIQEQHGLLKATCTHWGFSNKLLDLTWQSPDVPSVLNMYWFFSLTLSQMLFTPPHPSSTLPKTLSNVDQANLHFRWQTGKRKHSCHRAYFLPWLVSLQSIAMHLLNLIMQVG